MSNILDSLKPTASWESGLASLGMATPAKRFVVGTAVGAALVWAFRPEAAYDANGQPKSWVMIADPSQDSTSVPWWGLAMIPGVIFSTFF